jgi:hypothetical protein
MPQGLTLPSVGLQQDTNMYAYSNGFFYPLSMRDDYEAANSWPDSFVEVGEEIYLKFTANPPQGKMRGTDGDGMPSWVDVPPPTHEEIVAQADVEKQSRIDAANDYMNYRQWPGKAAMGRLKDTEKAQYNAWLDYLDALEAVDTSVSPDITWPDHPA